MTDTTTAYEIEVPLRFAGRGKQPVPMLTANERLHWRARTSRTATLRQTIAIRAREAGIPSGGHLAVTLHYQPGDNRRRDADNLVPTLKACCDALARGPRRDWIGLELVPDDTPKYMTKHMPVIHEGPGPRRMWLEIEVSR